MKKGLNIRIKNYTTPVALKAMSRTLVLMSLLLFPLETLYSQYNVGDVVSAEDLNKQFMYCSNEAGSSTLGELLASEVGTPTRALWINFFASW